MDADKAKLVLDVAQTKYGGAGVVSAYLLKHIAANAGAFAPGIQDRMFFDLQRRGTGIPQVQRWFMGNLDRLNNLGYGFFARDVTLETPALRAWVDQGRGFRGAIVPADGSKLHEGIKESDIGYTVGLCRGEDGLMMIDPWPGSEPRMVPPPEELEPAHRARNYMAIAVFWRGYS